MITRLQNNTIKNEGLALIKYSWNVESAKKLLILHSFTSHFPLNFLTFRIWSTLSGIFTISHSSPLISLKVGLLISSLLTRWSYNGFYPLTCKMMVPRFSSLSRSALAIIYCTSLLDPFQAIQKQNWISSNGLLFPASPSLHLKRISSSHYQHSTSGSQNKSS